MKTGIEDLAWLGGKRMFERVRPIGQLGLPNPDRFFALARRLYDDGDDCLVAMLEERLAAFHGTRYCVACGNASLALVMVMALLAEGRHGQVIMPSFTYPGLPHLAQWAGQMPLFCDIDPRTHTLDPEAVATLLSDQVTAILGVHHVNSPCRIDELQALADRAGVPLFFDSVHAFGCTYRGLPIGRFGRAEVFSLHATKLLNGFEGGYVTTADGALAQALRDGIRPPGAASAIGTGGLQRLSGVHAAAALAGLDDIDAVIGRNRERVEAYRAHFQGLPGLSWLPYDDASERFNYEFALLEVGEEWLLGRDPTVAIMRAENALARPYYAPPLHLSPHCPPNMAPPSLPVTEALSKRFIQMPVGELVSLDDIAALAELFHFIHHSADAILHRAAR